VRAFISEFHGEVEYVLVVGPPELLDGLSVIPHDQKVLVFTSVHQTVQDLVLDVVGVLVLIDHDVLLLGLHFVFEIWL